MAKPSLDFTPLVVPLVLGMSVLFLAAALIGLLRKIFRESAGSKNYRYEREDSLLTAAERSFFGVLAELRLPYYVATKVRIADIIKPVESGSKWRPAFNAIAQKHVDFLLCDSATLRPLLVVELDDSSHREKRARKRDGFVDAAFRSANIPVLRFAASHGYQPNSIAEKIILTLRQS